MSTRNSPGGKGGRCVRLTTYHPHSVERQEIWGLNLPGPPWVISTACCGRDLYLYLYHITYHEVRLYSVMDHLFYYYIFSYFPPIFSYFPPIFLLQSSEPHIFHSTSVTNMMWHTHSS